MAKLLTDDGLYDIIKRAKEGVNKVVEPQDAYVYVYNYTTLHFSNQEITDHGDNTLTGKHKAPKDASYSVPTSVPWYSVRAQIITITSENNFIPPISTRNMFFGFTKLANVDDLAYWNTSAVTDMGRMFHTCAIPTVDPLSSWKTSNVTNMANMFYTCKNVSTFEPLNGWDVSNVQSHTDMFSGTTGTRPTWGTSW